MFGPYLKQQIKSF